MVTMLEEKLSLTSAYKDRFLTIKKTQNIMDNRKIEDLTNRIIKEEQTLLKDRMLFNWIALEVINFVEYQAIVKKLALCGVSQQRELLLAYHKHLDSFNDPTIYNASESMIDDYLANNCG